MELGEGQGVTDGPSEIMPEAQLLVSCIWCDKLHWAEHPLELNPACPACAAGDSIMRSLEMNGAYPLSDESIAYSYAPSAEEAFAKECRNYDDFGGSRRLDNAGPPARAPGALGSA
jgi:hypothetical protein